MRHLLVAIGIDLGAEAVDVENVQFGHVFSVYWDAGALSLNLPISNPKPKLSICKVSDPSHAPIALIPTVVCCSVAGAAAGAANTT